MKRFKTICAAVMAFTINATAGSAATCGNTGAGFDAWKASFSKDAKKAGVKANGLAALAGATYATKTIAADRNQKSFKYASQMAFTYFPCNSFIIIEIVLDLD